MRVSHIGGLQSGERDTSVTYREGAVAVAVGKSQFALVFEQQKPLGIHLACNPVPHPIHPKRSIKQWRYDKATLGVDKSETVAYLHRCDAVDEKLRTSVF